MEFTEVSELNFIITNLQPMNLEAANQTSEINQIKPNIQSQKNKVLEDSPNYNNFAETIINSAVETLLDQQNAIKNIEDADIQLLVQEKQQEKKKKKDSNEMQANQAQVQKILEDFKEKEEEEQKQTKQNLQQQQQQRMQFKEQKIIKQPIQNQVDERVSILSQSFNPTLLDFKPAAAASQTIYQQYIKNPNTKDTKFFLNCTKNFIIVSINMEISVSQVIKQVLMKYIQSEKFSNEIIKYPNKPELYELRLLEDDDGYLPIMDFAPLDQEKCLKTFDQSTFVLLENEKKVKQLNSITQFVEEKQDFNPNILKIEIYFYEERFSEIIEIDKNLQINDLFQIIEDKFTMKYNKNKVEIKVLPTTDSIEKGNLTEPESVNFNMPLYQLATNKIQIENKKFADEPEVNYGVIHSPRLIRNSQLKQKDDDVVEEVLINQITAIKFEEFEVIKINQKGKQQKRVLGIDQFKIYNGAKKESSSILNFFGQKSMHPERQIKDIKTIKQLNSKSFSIIISDEYNKLKSKNLQFQTKTEQEAMYIVKKLQFLLNHNKK